MMTELDNFINEDKLIESELKSDKEKLNVLIINDKDYKTTRQTNFYTNYLSFREELNLMIFKNFTIYSRNLKTIIFIFLTPIFFLSILQIIQNLSDNFNKSIDIKNHHLNDIDRIDLKCTQNENNFSDECISIGIAVIGNLDEKEKYQMDYLLSSIANQTNLQIGTDIQLISNETHEEMYKYFEMNRNRVQYAVAFCYESFSIGNYKIPCQPQFNPRSNSSEFNLYTIVYNISNVSNGFLESFNRPWPHDKRLLKLKIVIDNAYLAYYSHLKNQNKNQNYISPYISNITTQAFPSPKHRLSSNVDIISVFGIFYMYFPPMILFSTLLIDIVKEKELMLKSYMNLYGLSIISYWASWVIIATITSSIVSMEFTLFGKYAFRYSIFDNTNILVPFILFFLFCFSMQILAMFISCLVNNSNSANTVSYSIILVGIIIQCLFTNYGIIYFFYATNIEKYKFIIKLVLFILNFYPPFLFSKSYTNLIRICAYHFDSLYFKWIPGRYFTISDLFSKETGKLRIGLEYEVDSLFQTFIWFYFLIIFYMFLIGLCEIKESYKNISQFQSFMKLFIDICNMNNVKKLNIRKSQMENKVNKNYDKFIKADRLAVLNDEKVSFIVKESDISVVSEKKEVALLNKKGKIPNGIRILSISKTYESGLTALIDINLEIHKGEVFTILGPNGAGKSTLINILTSQLSSTEGFAKVGPFIIHSDLFIDSIYVKRMIGICSQSDYLWEDLTIFETLALYSRLRGIKQNKLENYIKEKISSVGLEKKIHERVSKLSGGMKRRLSICISTLGDPLIIFMDEPTTGLDPNNRRKIWKLINTIKQNRVIILTTHHMMEAEYLSDRLGILLNGKFRFIGNCTELRNLQWDGIILTIYIDLTKLGKRLFFFDDNLKFVFVRSQINYSTSGIYCIQIKYDNKRDIIKAFELFKRKSDDKRVLEMLDYMKDVQISQANMENIYLDLCYKYK